MGIRTELSLRLPNSPGVLQSVCQRLADDRVTIDAMALDAGGQLHLLVDNPSKAIASLREGHHRVSERDVVVLMVPVGPEALAPILKLVSDAGVNLDYAYSGVQGRAGIIVVLGVDDAVRVSAAAGV